MIKGIIVSIFYHIIIFIIISLYSLIFYKKITINNNIKISVVNSRAILQSYPTSAEKQPKSTQEKALSTSVPIGVHLKADEMKKIIESMRLKIPNKKVIDKPQTLKGQRTQSPLRLKNKSNFLTKLAKGKEDTLTSHDLISKGSKKSFVEKLAAQVKHSSLSEKQLKALSKQIGSCWYVQGAVDKRISLNIQLTLVLDKSANIKTIQVDNPEIYNTPLKKAILNQAISALKNPKCIPLKLPLYNFSHWHIIHIEFNSKNLYNISHESN